VVVKVLFFGVLKDLTGLAEDTAEVPAGTSVADLFAAYSRRFETLEAARPSMLFARNQEFVTGGTILAERDEVAFLPPVSGGA
jgi:molybdopterin synthase catalytic subunit